MEKDIGDEILRAVRDAYRANKPTDKTYVLTEDQKENAALHDKAVKRSQLDIDSCFSQESWYRLHPSKVLAEDAQDKAHQWKYSSRICSVTFGYGSTHAFCVADFYQQDDLPRCVQDISPNEYNNSAWVIDPWTNISCRFSDYPLNARRKFMKWSAQGKRVTRSAIDPSSPRWNSLFFTRPLIFRPPLEPELREERFLTTKRARGDF